MITATAPRIGGMLVGYYRLCPRKAWWSLRGIWMEQESDTVALGRLLDEAAYARADKHLQVEAEAPDGTPLIGKIDRAKLREGVLHETKKGRSCEDAHRWQVRFLPVAAAPQRRGPCGRLALRRPDRLPAAAPHRDRYAGSRTPGRTRTDRSGHSPTRHPGNPAARADQANIL